MAVLLDRRKRAAQSAQSTQSTTTSSKPMWQIVERHPDTAMITVALKVGDMTKKIDLKGVPAASAYFARPYATKGQRS